MSNISNNLETGSCVHWLTIGIIVIFLFSKYFVCYNLGSSNEAKKKSCIRFIQENLIKSQVQSVYLIYTRIIVCVTQNLAYSKEYIYYMLLIYNMISSF